MKKPKHKSTPEKITQEIFNSTPDDELPDLIWNFIWLKIGKDDDRRFDIFATLPVGYEIIYVVNILNNEVTNGGFNQYFVNGGNSYAEFQIAALKRIGANLHLIIFRKALKIHEQEKSNEALQELYKDRTLESISLTYKITNLGMCDDEWYVLAKEFDTLQKNFIRQHPRLFITE